MPAQDKKGARRTNQEASSATACRPPINPRLSDDANDQENHDTVLLIHLHQDMHPILIETASFNTLDRNAST